MMFSFTVRTGNRNGRETGQVLIGTVNEVKQDRERTAICLQVNPSKK